MDKKEAWSLVRTERDTEHEEISLNVMLGGRGEGGGRGYGPLAALKAPKGHAGLSYEMRPKVNSRT